MIRKEILPPPVVRQERPEDCQAISVLTELAFRDMPFAGGDEQVVIDRLRAAGALELSLVAIVENEIIGQVTFSPATNTDDSQPWFALGPVSVTPACQHQGIGSALINRGLAEIKDRGAKGCILTGNPNYYRRFGFELAPQNVPSNEPAEFFMLKPFTSEPPTGSFKFHSAFYGDVTNHG